MDGEPDFGTDSARLWLLRSRPDQVRRRTMRRGPPRKSLTGSGRRVRAPQGVECRHRIECIARPGTAHSQTMMEPTTDSIDAFIDALWLEDGLSKNTLSAYRSDLDAFGHWLAKNRARTLPAAAESDIQDWFAAMHATSRTSTANRRLAALRRYFLWARRQGLVERDPCLKLQASRQPPRFPKTLSEAQVEALLQAPDISTTLGLRDRAMLETLYATGLRVS